MSQLEKFANRINELIAEKELSAYALTKALNIPYATAQAWFVGKSFPSVEYLIKLSKFFNCTIDYLLGISEV